MANILAFAETRQGEFRKIAFETITAARQLADATGGGEVHALVAGAPGIAPASPRAEIPGLSARFAVRSRESAHLLSWLALSRPHLCRPDP